MRDYKKLYDLTKEYLLIKGQTLEEIKKENRPINVKPKDRKDLFEGLIESAQNYYNMPNIIKYSIRKEEIRKILHDDNLEWIKEQDAEELYNVLIKKYNSSKVSNSWHKWTCSVIDSAKFVLEYKSLDEFEKFVKMMDKDIKTRIAMPLIISRKIKGMGFALGCDFLKELGFENYSKPDVHIKDIFEKIGWVPDRNEIKVFEEVNKMSEVVNEKAFFIDKVLWVICKKSKSEFIEYLKKNLEEK